MVSSHRRNGLHMIEQWNGSFFEHSSLKALGLRFQLGHPIGETCPKPITPYNDDFVVIHTNGVHEVGVNFCKCFNAPERFVQLLRYGWFPATTHQPRTAASLAVLKRFQIHSFESKCSAFEFYQALARLGDNTGIRPVRDRYRAFLVMVREYRHIKMVKRAGRGHDVTGIAGTKLGECAVLCPACPQPQYNLPDNWADGPEETRWIYRLFLAIDANFRLKRRKVSSESADPSLGSGWAYFVEQGPYAEHIKNFADQFQAKSTCSSHSAVNNSRITDGLATSGVGSVGCARHDCFRPHSVGDLQKGERLCTVHYVDGDVVVSYDIACQWCRNLWERIQRYAKSLQLDEDLVNSFMFLVPKFHLPAHIGKCQTQYSFNLHSHVGRTDGEAPERGWSHINPIALSTCEMGPGSRRDTLEDHFGDSNWKKTYQMGTTLLRRIKAAVDESSEQTLLFHRMEGEVQKWEKEIEAWEADWTSPNPFETRIKKPTQEAVRRALAEEDRKAQEEGRAYALHTTFSGSELIAVGMELEEHQRRLHLDTKAHGPHATDDQKAKLLSKGNNLHRRIEQWIEVQERYIPSTESLRQDGTNPANSIRELWETPLFLPSAIPSSVPCDPRLQDVEWRLRSAQAHSALDELRRCLRMRSYLFIDKDQFSRGQHQNTRSQGMIQRTNTKVNAAAAKYREARACLKSLSRLYDGDDWKNRFPTLKDEDIRSLQADSEEKTKKKKKADDPSEGHRKVSWIWGALGDGVAEVVNDELKDDLRVEWCKSRARCKRWQEEVVLLTEEMRRVLMFLDTSADRWRAKANFQKKEVDGMCQEGIQAYALQQNSLCLDLKSHFKELWRYVDDYVQSKGKASVSPLQSIIEEPKELEE
ncbi:hypothetical protein BDN72DRAFT_873055 [Pluteus cervinus]|uniref:Uncharacterized protein n=1 Tax=Pluteus cervinus TaxID=181527 RepID=A0ACD3A1S7_9AGAR|nr:hypothetical protein BDN72DRAFT_873055 [Pluteus cervinus]